jgi:hypothetical protein
MYVCTYIYIINIYHIYIHTYIYISLIYVYIVCVFYRRAFPFSSDFFYSGRRYKGKFNSFLIEEAKDGV